MKFLITAATANEIAAFSPADEDTDILITGVGIAATVYHIQKRLHQLDYDMIIQAGFAGSFSNELQLGETVMVDKDCFGDLGAEEHYNFKTVFNMGLAVKDEFPFNDGWLVNTTPLIADLNYKKVSAITVNKVSDSLLVRQQRENSFDPAIETMEGAAFHYICLQESIPFIQLRTISNKVGERDKEKWLLDGSVENLGMELNNLVKKLKEKS